MNNRTTLLEAFVKASLRTDSVKLASLGGDASFRRYYRFNGYIIVDSPPETQKNQEFADINKRLAMSGIRVPEIVHMDIDSGFFILEDLGDTLFYNEAAGSNALLYYKRAVDMLLVLSDVCTDSLPGFDRSFILTELNICNEWCFDKALSLYLDDGEQKLLTESYAVLADNCLNQKQIAMHRDFHCRNIMLYKGSLCCIDYQDMVRGPLLYDLASLLFDCYIKLDNNLLEQLKRYGYERLAIKHCPDMTFADYEKALYMTSLQRHIKVLGIFNRLYLRDCKSSYLKYLPLVVAYVLDECDRCGLSELGAFFKRNIEGRFS